MVQKFNMDVMLNKKRDRLNRTKKPANEKAVTVVTSIKRLFNPHKPNTVEAA
jgi:hypothetical protein